MQKQVYKCPNHIANLNNMRLNNKWCDLTIKIDEKKYRAHKNILAANLKYFETKLSNDSFQEGKESVITMKLVEAKDLEEFITYAYTGEISLTEDNALSLLELANYLGEEGIKQACVEFLEKHLKVEESCRAYNLAESIECLSLKNAAKSLILSNFENCSQTSEYLDFNFERLTDILSQGKTQTAESQQVLFEGVVKWIMRVAESRKIHMNDLFSLIDVTKLPADYFVNYIGSMATRKDNDFGVIATDLMAWYYASSKSQESMKRPAEHSKQTLMILGSCSNKAHLQFYNFTEKKWSQPQETCINRSVYSGAILNNKLYYISENAGRCDLQVLDPTTKRTTTLSSSNDIFLGAAVCACSRFLYFCGGSESFISSSARVLRYDPQTNSFEILPPMGAKRWGAAAVFYRGCLYVLGGIGSGSTDLDSVKKYDFDTKKWTQVPSMCEKRVVHAVAVLDDKLYACGGLCDSQSAEVYDPATNSWQPIASINKKRRYFTLVAHEGKLLAVGGDFEKTVEVYDPSKDEWQMDDEMSSGLQTNGCVGGLISSSDVADA